MLYHNRVIKICDGMDHVGINTNMTMSMSCHDETVTKSVPGNVSAKF